MFNKKLISTALSALTIFPTVAPLVSANGSQANEQPQPSNTAPVSAPEATDTGTIPPAQKRPHQAEPQADAQPQPSNTAPASAPEAADTGTVPPAQKRPHQAEPQADTAAKADSESAPKRLQFSYSNPNLKKAYDSLQTVDEFTNRFRDNAASNAGYMDFFTSPNKLHSPMDELYTHLSKLTVNLNDVYYSTNYTREERNRLKKDVANTLENLHATVLNALKKHFMCSEDLKKAYELLRQNVLRGKDLFTTDNFAMRARLRTLIAKSRERSIPGLHYLYLAFLISTTTSNIKAYFYNCIWHVKRPDGIDFYSARDNLTKYLSGLLKDLHKIVFSNPFGMSPGMFSYVASGKKILNLEISDADIDISPNILMDILDSFNNLISKAIFIIPNPHNCFIKNYLYYIFCYCPMYPESLENTVALQSKSQEVNTKIFQAIERANFDKVPGLEEAFRDVFKDRDSLFDSNLSPDEYCENFTYRILTSKSPRFTENSALRERLYKLSVLANIMVCIQQTPCKCGLESNLKRLNWRLQTIVPKEMLPVFDLSEFPFSVFARSNFFDVVEIETTPAQ